MIKPNFNLNTIKQTVKQMDQNHKNDDWAGFAQARDRLNDQAEEWIRFLLSEINLLQAELAAKQDDLMGGR